MSGELVAGQEDKPIELSKKDAEHLRANLIGLKGQIESSYIAFSKQLWKALHATVSGDPLYQVWGYATFDDYAETELGMKRGKAYYLAQIWGEIHVKAQIPEAKIAEMDWCMPPDTQISTPSGYVDLGSIKIGDSVFAANGDVATVDAVENLQADHLYEITCDYVGKIRATAHHWFPVIKNGAELFRKLSRKGRLSKGELPEYAIERTKTDSIEPGDMLVIPRTNLTIEGSPFSDRPIEFFEFAGWYVAEGYVDRNRLVIKLGTRSEGDLDDVIALAETAFPECSMTTHENAGDEYGPRWQMTVSQDADLARAFSEWFGDGANNKRVPESFFALSPSQLTAFLRGLWLGDGSRSKKAVHVVDTTSYTLATQVRLLLNRVGIPGGVCVTRRDAPWADLWTVYVGIQDGHTLLGNLCPPKFRGYRWYKSIPEGMAVIVRSVKRTAYSGPVIHLGTSHGTFCCPVNSYNSHAKELAPLAKTGGLTPKNVDTWVKKAKLKPVVQFAEEVKAARKAHVSGTSEPPETIHRITVGLYEEQFRNYTEAIKHAGQLAESEKVGHLWDLICTEFNAQYAGQKGGDRKKAIKRYVSMMERSFGVRVIVIDPDSDAVLAGKDMAKELTKGD